MATNSEARKRHEEQLHLFEGYEHLTPAESDSLLGYIEDQYPPKE